MAKSERKRTHESRTIILSVEAREVEPTMAALSQRTRISTANFSSVS
jgi:hypothetical protein